MIEPPPNRLARWWVAALALAAALPARAGSSDDLTALSLEQLQQLRVVGASKYEQKQSAVAAAVSVITRQDIQAFGWRTLGEALASLPGVYTSYDRLYTYLGTRGFGLPGDFNTRVLITINGNRVNEPAWDQGPVGREFPLDMGLVERIEFIPGPSGAVYGQNAMFGVVNVITRTGADLGGAEVMLAGQHPQALREGRASWGRVFANGTDVLLSVSGLHERGQDLAFDYGAAGVSGVATGLDGLRGKQFFASLRRGPWSFDVEHSDGRKDDPTATSHSDPLVAGQYVSQRFDLAQAQYRDRYADATVHLLARLFAGRESYYNVLSYGTPYAFATTGEWRGMELRLLWTAIAGHTLMTGMELQDNLHRDQGLVSLANPAVNVFIPRSGQRVGLYAQDEWKLADTLSATLGARLDRDDATGSHASPRAALIWQAAGATTIKAMAGRAHRPPNANERDYHDTLSQVANPGLRGERIDTLELVADHRLGSAATLRASVYQWTLRDLVALGIDTASGLSQYQSGGPVQARGLELSADTAWAEGARARGSVSFQHVVDAADHWLINSPRLLAKLELSAPLRWAGLRAAGELQYDSPRLSEDGTRLGGYALANLTLRSAALAPGLTLTVGLTNLFDKRYEQPGAATNWQNALVQDGRAARAQIDYRL